MMANYGLAHWIVFALVGAILIYPIGRILRRIGFSPFWSIAAFVPLLNLIALWVLAFVDWPTREGTEVKG
jgi:hypothetical protein